MPVYEYRCEECQHRFDQLTTAARADEATCPSCGGGRSRRLLSVIAGLGGAPEPPAPACGAGACGACR